MNDGDVVNDDLFRDVFDRYQTKLAFDLINVVNTVRCCECGHKSRIQLVQDKMMWFKRMTRLYQVILVILILTTIMLVTYGFWLGRHYNRIIFGGCSSCWIWPFDDCPVAF